VERHHYCHQVPGGKLYTRLDLDVVGLNRGHQDGGNLLGEGLGRDVLEIELKVDVGFAGDGHSLAKHTLATRQLQLHGGSGGSGSGSRGKRGAFTAATTVR